MIEVEKTTLIMSRIHSKLPIFALSHNTNILNLTAIYRGITLILLHETYHHPCIIRTAIKILSEKRYLISEDLVIIVKNEPLNISLNDETKINTIHITQI